MRGRWIGLAGLLAVAAGCGDGRVACYPVSGSVTVKGKPADGAQVVFHPAAGESAAPRPTAVVGADGTFKLTTYAAGDGAPVGSYKVTVRWLPKKKGPGEMDGPDRLGERYAVAGSTKLTATVGPAPTDVPVFTLE